ncbi:Os05g0440466, partial [Oryza sativa Japonica Group]
AVQRSPAWFYLLSRDDAAGGGNRDDSYRRAPGRGPCRTRRGRRRGPACPRARTPRPPPPSLPPRAAPAPPPSPPPRRTPSDDR